MPDVTEQDRALIVKMLREAARTYRTAIKGVEPGNPKPDVQALRKTILDRTYTAIWGCFPKDNIRNEFLEHIRNASARTFIPVILDGASNYQRGDPNFVIAIACCRGNDNTPIFSAVNYPMYNRTISVGKDIPLQDTMGTVELKDGSGANNYVVAVSFPQPLGDNLAPTIDLIGRMRDCIIQITGCPIHDAMELFRGRIDGMHAAQLSTWILAVISPFIAAMGGRFDFIWSKVEWNENCDFHAGTDKYMKYRFPEKALPAALG